MSYKQAPQGDLTFVSPRVTSGILRKPIRRFSRAFSPKRGLRRPRDAGVAGQNLGCVIKRDDACECGPRASYVGTARGPRFTLSANLYNPSLLTWPVFF